MAGMREIKMRIKGIKDTRQITKAMKLIAAAKLKKARQQLEQTRPFFEKVNDTIADILSHSANIESPYFDLRREKEVRKKAYLIISGDKTLAGGYNYNLHKFAEEKINGDKEALLFVAGQIGRSYFIKEKYNVCKDFLFPVQNVTVYRAREIQKILLEHFRNEHIDEIDLIYTKVKSSISLEPTIIKLLPLDIQGLKCDSTDNNRKTDCDENILYEPTSKAVLQVLIPKYIKGIVYGAMVEGFTSEQSARMTAMDNATTNADEMLQKLNLYYNRARQAMITQEVSEIVSGAEALK
jgi:F-type H+-transporting ATPase subunit gamma